jgi:hypothetical protein
LEHGLGVEPLVHLDAVVEFQDRFVDLRGSPPALVGELLIVAVVAVGKGDTNLVLVAYRE